MATSVEDPAAPSAKARIGAYAWYALFVLVLVYIVNFIDRQIISILAQDIKRDLALDDAQIGFLYGTAFAVFYALFGIPLGRLADSWYRGRLIAIGLGMWSSMTVLSGFASNFTMLAAARIGVGIGEASASPAAYSMISDRFPKGEAGDRTLHLFERSLYRRRAQPADRRFRHQPLDRGLARSGQRAARPRRLAGGLPRRRSSRPAARTVGDDAARAAARRLRRTCRSRSSDPAPGANSAASSPPSCRR